MSEVAAAHAGARERIAAVPMPDRIRALPVDARGYPVPKFVEYRDGVPDFRIMDSRHLVSCVQRKICWVCGQPLGRNMSFAVGPMCIVNRTSAEPPSHLECVRYSAKVCPFLAIPAMRRIEHGLPEGHTQAGIGIKRNPGVICLWTVRAYKVWKSGGVLFDIGEPDSVEWWARGRAATREEVEASITSGMPILQKMADEEGPGAQAELTRLYRRALPHLPALAIA
jgi:hypothetical protein